MYRFRRQDLSYLLGLRNLENIQAEVDGVEKSTRKTSQPLKKKTIQLKMKLI